MDKHTHKYSILSESKKKLKNPLMSINIRSCIYTYVTLVFKHNCKMSFLFYFTILSVENVIFQMKNFLLSAFELLY